MNDPMMELEHQLERDMQSSGYHSFMALVQEAKAKGREADTVYGSLLMRKGIEPVAERIRTFLLEQEGRRGPKHVAAGPLTLVEPEVAALITLRALIDRLSCRAISIASVATHIGTMVETEIALAHFESDSRPLFNTVVRSLNKRTANPRHRRTTLLTMAKRHAGYDPTKKWATNFRLHVGMALLDFALAETGLFTATVARSGKQTTRIIQAQPEVLDLATTVAERAALLSPTRKPMVVPPKPWSALHSGGYHFMPPATHSMIKVNGRNSAEEIDNLIDTMQQAIEALNTAQRTPWRVNKAVLEVAEDLWKNNVSVGSLARLDPLDLPHKPVDIETNAEARADYTREAAAIHSENRRSLSKRIQSARTLQVAAEYAAYDRFYFPHEFDFRGRMYPVPSMLNPQGGDLSRGLLEFADGMPLGDDPEVWRWLYIHMANQFGHDKLSHDDRIEWAEKNWPMLVRCGRDPLEHREWMDADEPWQALACCFEANRIEVEGRDTPSHLIVAMDGTCNGLQHFSAMLRDEVGGTATNLVPSDKPSDIYQIVADKVVDRLTAMADEPLAAEWLAIGIDRKITKRPVMVLPYGGTRHSCRQYVEDAARERGPLPWETRDVWSATYFLAAHVWDAIGETVVAAREAMDWLQQVSKVVADAGLPLVWTMPDGFPVFQNYTETKHNRVKTKLGDQVIKVSLYTPTRRKIDKAKQAMATSPNFVHSYDALALRHYILIAADNGIEAFATVHDSYGVHAANAPLSAACLREAFVDVYASVDPLARLDAEVRDMLTPEEAEALPPLPAKGSLDINEVRNAHYFFS